MPTLMMAKAPSGAGKSFFFTQELQPKGWLRVSRDGLRPMLYGEGWLPKREKLVRDTERAVVIELAKHGQNIYIDDTNLRDRDEYDWRVVAEELKYQFEVKTFDTSLLACFARDTDRPRPVGHLVIYRQFLTGGFIPWGKKPIVIVDLDGTTIDCSHRLHFIESCPKDHESFFAATKDDSPIWPTILEIQKLAKDYTICIVTGRNMEKQGVATIEQLFWFGIPYAYVFMRNGGDRRPDLDVKLEMVNQILKQTAPGQVVRAYEDRQYLIDAYRTSGISVVACSSEGIQADFPAV